MADTKQKADRDETVLNRHDSERTAIANNAPPAGTTRGGDLDLHDYEEVSVSHEDTGDGYAIIKGVSFNAIHDAHTVDDGSPARIELRPWNGGTDTQVVVAGATLDGKAGSTTIRYYIPPK